MKHSQFLRIESKAGGVFCTPYQFIKAAFTVLSKQGKTRQMRDSRHAWLRSGLGQLTTNNDVFLTYKF
jgi:hypothetical protein